MYINLKFDFYSDTIYISDGYIFDVSALQENFFEWIHDQPSCFANRSTGPFGLAYDSSDFLRFVNEVILNGSSERAYFISNPRITRKKTPVLRF